MNTFLEYDFWIGVAENNLHEHFYLAYDRVRDGKTIPLVGSLNVTKSTFIEYYSGAKPKIVNVELFDSENTRFDKYQLAGVDF